MNNITVKSLGPIDTANINFGDITLFVGPQASGKSILLQLIKLLIDKKNILSTVEQYGFVWGDNEKDILDRYFGEGMSGIWNESTKISFDKKSYSLKYLLPKRGEETAGRLEGEHLFYIPAQRVVCLQNGWPRYFTDYEDSVPFVLRDFSETLRLQLEKNNSDGPDFPQRESIRDESKKSFDDSIFHHGKISIDRTNKKRFKLDVGKSSIPYMAWSAGQKEFMPLLLSFYYLCPDSKTKKRHHIDYVIIEEPEMGLHPQAIKSVLLQVIDLMSRGYKVIISTHSPVLLEFAWALENLQKNEANNTAVAQLFDINKPSTDSKKMFDSLLKGTIKTYFFDRIHNKVTVKDISSLDAGSNDEAVAQWGGLTSFSSKTIDVVSNSVAHE